MNADSPKTASIRRLFKKQRIAELSELKATLQTPSTMTVFRRLKELGYRTSYSHRGRFYTLNEIPRFDDQGLWFYREAAFSQWGNLLETARHLVEQADAGLTAAELQYILRVEVKQSLLRLFRRKQLHRERIGPQLVYLARDKQQRTRQKQERNQYVAAGEIGLSPLGEELSRELNAAIILFFSLLDEKQRRLYAGLEAFKLGHGGDRRVAEFLGLDVHTVARGRGELVGGDVTEKGVRKKGAGRKPVAKKRRR